MKVSAVFPSHALPFFSTNVLHQTSLFKSTIHLTDKNLKRLMIESIPVTTNVFVIAGECKCEPGYGLADCSVRLPDPPVLYQLANSGLCDVNKSYCDIVATIGAIFVDSSDLTCILQPVQVTSCSISLGALLLAMTVIALPSINNRYVT